MRIKGIVLSASTFIGLLLITSPARSHPGGDASPTPPTVKPANEKPKADPEAYALLEAAHNNRQTFPANFPGLAAEVVFNDNGRVTTGTLTYRPGEGVKTRMEGLPGDASGWLDGMISNLLGHRRGGDFAKGDGRHPLTFGTDDRSPLGRRMQLGDALQSSYRVRGKQVVEVTRTMGDERFTITVLETMPVEGGKYLPRHFMVTYFDAKTGALRRVQSYSDTHARIDGVWLPTSRRVILAQNGEITTRLLELRNPRLLPASEASAR